MQNTQILTSTILQMPVNWSQSPPYLLCNILHPITSQQTTKWTAAMINIVNIMTKV